MEIKSVGMIIKITVLILIMSSSLSQLQAYPGRGEDHGQEYDPGNAPGDPGGGDAPVGPIDGGISILIAGGVALYVFRKRKRIISQTGA